MKSSRIHRLAGVAVAASLALLTACGSSDPLESNGSSGGDPNSIVVGSANFPESETVGFVYAEALRANGFDVQTKMNIGSREIYVPALRDGSLTLIPDYTGNLLDYIDPSSTATTAEEIDAALPAALAPDLAITTPAPAEDKDAVVVTRETAEKWNLTSIADLAAHSAEVKFAAPAEFQERAVGLPGLRENYGLEISPSNFVPIADGGGPTTVKALTSGQVTAANIFTTSPAIEANDLVVLADPKSNFPAQNVVPLLRASAKTEQLARVLDAVSAKLTTEELVGLNDAVSGDSKTEPEAAAKQWVARQGLDAPVS
ncbi:osmoprotectant transport system substrate-binding protein [Rhodococcus sp. AG1013]|uniref:ABC transporter substrate-binding protein n=1 Tax=Rhodococcus sp. AG1013 TaxID=2183996 RepID=UPI000E0BCF6C|nr:ABC transporter substrate-binding protein [Rhodococcus sp. AG1013]RDI35987.1 osmoprotectant transport system substrate-binding protein [Rhodococcus sp. AG1013]